jgi:hypothetical protein
MVPGRARVAILGALLALSACRGQSTNPKRSGTGSAGTSPSGSAGTSPSGSAGTGTEGGAPSETGGSAPVGGAGTPATGGSGTAGNGGVSGLGGSAGAGNGAGTAGSTAPAIPELPGASEREREIVAPLGTDDATIDATTGGDLLELGLAIGAARGYAMCRCAWSPDMPPMDVEEVLRGCGGEESGLRELVPKDSARCFEEGMASLPAAEAYLRCRIKWSRDDAAKWVDLCSNPEVQPVPAEFCEASPETQRLLDDCQFAVYCADGVRVEGRRCDFGIDCADQSDELGCFETSGRDWFWCDPELEHPSVVCHSNTCGLEKTPPVCDPDRPNVYLCDDRSEVSVESVCNRASDCPDGSDERYCFK